MTVRLPLLTQDDEAIKEWSNADRDQVHKRIAYCYANSPSVFLNVVNSGGNLTPADMNDTRLRSGPAHVTTGNQDTVDDGDAEYVQQSDTGDPESLTETTYDKISQIRTNPGLNWGQTSYPGNFETGPGPKPVYYEGRTTGNPGTDGGYSIREMSFQDVLDTFIDPVVNYIHNGTTSDFAGGSFFISSAVSETNSMNLGMVFQDTNADPTSFDAAQIGTDGTYQQGTTNVNTTYYLYKNMGVEETYRLPLVIDYTSNGVNNPAGLREMTQAEFQAFFCPLIRQQIYNGTGNTLNYNIDGSGVAHGTSITNTELDGASWNTRFVGTDDYRSQEFPDGSPQVINQWTLRLNRT